MGNKKLLELFNEPDNVCRIKGYRLRWFWKNERITESLMECGIRENEADQKING